VPAHLWSRRRRLAESGRNFALPGRPRPAKLFGMVTNKDDQAGRAAPPATGWGVAIALILVIAIFLFTGFESHWL